ncbi:hypothetical protein EST38_g11112 [Candolleomyces aberdarensis]|uniref:Uncharacterized protein n=1 Tax=Candolleomyces aberdarensis TaxID=2316362 RepID=A0A4Q2D8G6_9AGAR|nr:hypothetical protein EST38_g11112 [Candolleomyces aberdarensis]
MTRVLVVPAPNFNLPETLCLAMALDSEDFNEDSDAQRGVKRDSEGRPVVGLAAPAEPGPTTPAGVIARLQPNQTPKNQRRAAKRRREKARQTRQIRASAALKHLPQHTLITSAAEYVRLPAASCGYQAVNGRKGCSGRRYAVEDLRREGFVEVEWDGISSQVVVEENSDRVMVVMAGQPNDPSYRECHLRVAHKVLTAGEAAEFTAEELEHKRASNSAALNTGIFHGVGTSGPVNLSNGRHAQLLEGLVKDPDICRMASFADDVYEELEAKLDRLYENDPSLRPPFDCCVLPCAAFNFGPQVCCKGHRDHSNLPHSWCAITALGDFDSEKGGHLVVEELGIFIQFPAGATVLIPSALLTHGNTPVGSGETQDNLRKKVGKKEFQERMKLKETRWQEGLAKICTLTQLVDKYTPNTVNIQAM